MTKIGLLSVAAVLMAANSAFADDTIIRHETTTTTSLPAAEQPIQTESYRHHTSIDPSTGTQVEERTRTIENRAAGSETTTTTKVTKNDWSGVGVVRQLAPDHTVVVVNGIPYEVRGPRVSELAMHPDQNVTVIGRMDGPTKTIEIERFETRE